jgi:hypothetical protein
VKRKAMPSMVKWEIAGGVLGVTMGNVMGFLVGLFLRGEGAWRGVTFNPFYI